MTLSLLADLEDDLAASEKRWSALCLAVAPSPEAEARRAEGLERERERRERLLAELRAIGEAS